MKPEVTNTREIFKGRVFTVTAETILEDGRELTREIVNHPGSACVIALDENNEALLVKQYRQPARDYLLEIVAGSRDTEAELPEACAHRELEEELGVRAGRLELLAEFYPSPGFLAEKMWLYLARDLSTTKQNLDADEILEIVRVPLQEALQMIERQEIHDAKTIIGLQLAARRVI